jgi:hypothetical protein
MKAGATGRYVWTPPPATAGFSFSRPPKTDGPPFVWEGLAPNTSVQVSFTLPQKPLGVTGAWRVSETFEVSASDGQSDRVVHTTTLDTVAAAAQPLPEDPTGQPAAGAASVVWELARWFDFPSSALDTASCQSWVDFLRDDQAFLAVRLPVAQTAGGAIRAPFVSGPGYPSMLRIQRYVPSGYVYTATLELRPERLTFMANTLPQATAEQWLAFGVSADAPPCPAGLSINARNWTAMGTLFVDLSHRPDNCLGCLQPIYYCYEGQRSPLDALAFSVAGSPAAAEEGITCFGPQDAPIGGGPNWSVMGAGSLAAMPPETLRFLHGVANRTGADQDFNLTVQSDLAVPWRMFGGTSSAPNLAQPIASPLRLVDKQTRFIWLISDPLPQGTPPGSYSLRFAAALASAPAASRWASDIIWVGGWVPPPTPRPQATPSRDNTWLPVLNR